MSEWQRSFQNRKHRFASYKPHSDDDIPVSIKIRVVSGCYHREHSPIAYSIIDKFLNSISGDKSDFAFEEHESGPEILVYLAITTAGLALAKSVVDLIVTILKARSDGIKSGDRPSEPLELIVRRIIRDGELHEEKILRVNPSDDVKKELIEKTISDFLSDTSKKELKK